MNFTSKTFALGLAMTGPLTVGCGGRLAGDSTGSPGNSSPGSSSPGTTQPIPEDSGDVALNVTLRGGQTIQSLKFTLSNGAASDTVTGAIPLGSVPSPAFVVPTYWIPANAATGYTVILTGTSTGTGSVVTCAGTSGPFALKGGEETVVSADVTCTAVNVGSGPEVNQTIQTCPTVGTFTAVLPEGQAQLSTSPPSNTVTIYATANAPNLASLTYSFSVTTGHGTLGTPVVTKERLSATVVFTCPMTPETDTITLVKSDAIGAVCPAALTTSNRNGNLRSAGMFSRRNRLRGDSRHRGGCMPSGPGKHG
jgi:hypothetical protein